MSHDTENYEKDEFMKFLVIEEDLDSEDEEFDLAYLSPSYGHQDEDISLFIEDREQIDQKVAEWPEEQRVVITPDLLSVDAVHVPEIECFSFLNCTNKANQAPIVVMAMNKIRVTNYLTPHGLPIDNLDRSEIILI